MNGDFASAAVLISFGAVLGVLSPVQLIVMAFIEVVFYTLNEFIIIDLFKVISRLKKRFTFLLRFLLMLFALHITIFCYSCKLFFFRTSKAMFYL